MKMAKREDLVKPPRAPMPRYSDKPPFQGQEGALAAVLAAGVGLLGTGLSLPHFCAATSASCARWRRATLVLGSLALLSLAGYCCREGGRVGGSALLTAARLAGRKACRRAWQLSIFALRFAWALTRTAFAGTRACLRPKRVRCCCSCARRVACCGCRGNEKGCFSKCVAATFRLVSRLVGAAWRLFTSTVRLVKRVVVGTIRTIVRAVCAVINAIVAVITGIVRAVVAVIRGIIRAVFAVIRGIVSGVFAVFRGIFSLACSLCARKKPVVEKRVPRPASLDEEAMAIERRKQIRDLERKLKEKESRGGSKEEARREIPASSASDGESRGSSAVIPLTSSRSPAAKRGPARPGQGSDAACWMCCANRAPE